MLLPRYKMRTEGEHVYFNDKIKICDKTGEGSYIGYAGKENLVVG